MGRRCLLIICNFLDKQSRATATLADGILTNKPMASAKTRQIIWAKAHIRADFYPLTEVNGNEKSIQGIFKQFLTTNLQSLTPHHLAESSAKYLWNSGIVSIPL